MVLSRIVISILCGSEKILSRVTFLYVRRGQIFDINIKIELQNLDWIVKLQFLYYYFLFFFFLYLLFFHT